ncbi:MAG: hypothetical protein JW943_14645 [Deltaproteobacteria bacterium]|nr:hypothetical protein [Deltaproteobacteria bacterium]
MGFDTKAFLKAKFKPRTEAVPVPELTDFFPNGESPLWTVRGLTGQELGFASEAAERTKNITAIIDGLVAGNHESKTKAVRDLLGIGGQTPTDIAKRIEHLTMGSVNPPCTQELAVRLCETFPIEFYQLTNRIMALTGRGQEPGKSKPSGKEPTSGSASTSDTPEGGASSS